MANKPAIHCTHIFKMPFFWTLILQQPCQPDLGSYSGKRLIPTIRMHLFQSCPPQPVDSALLELSNPEYEFISCSLRRVRDLDMIKRRITIHMMYDQMYIKNRLPNVSVSFYHSIVCFVYQFFFKCLSTIKVFVFSSNPWFHLVQRNCTLRAALYTCLINSNSDLIRQSTILLDECIVCILTCCLHVTPKCTFLCKSTLLRIQRL